MHSSHAACVRHWQYRLSCQQFDSLLARAGDLCELCGAAPHVHIDHDHELHPTGVRGLVCARCNARLGRVDRNIEIADSAVRRFLARKPIMGDMPLGLGADRWDIVSVARNTGVSVCVVDLQRQAGILIPDGDQDGYPWWWRETAERWCAEFLASGADLDISVEQRRMVDWELIGYAHGRRARVKAVRRREQG